MKGVFQVEMKTMIPLFMEYCTHASLDRKLIFLRFMLLYFMEHEPDRLELAETILQFQ